MKKILILLIILGVIGAGGFAWWYRGISPVNKSDINKRIFVIPKGTGIRDIAANLKKEGFINDQVVFFLLVKKLQLDGKIQAGDFRLSPSMTAQQIAEELTHGTLDIWVTIPEGKRAQEIADILRDTIPGYEDSWRQILIREEGYLFPDTYLIPKDADITLIVNLMKGNFEKRYTELPTQNTRYNQQQIVILASLIEREAKYDQDRPLVASVLINRLSLGMPLQIDATVQYALGYQEKEKTWWKKALTLNDLKYDSPYNTYLNVGLPPGPISNPGLPTLSAIVSPAKTDYLYYISDSSGKNHYGKTLEEHNANIKKYGL